MFFLSAGLRVKTGSSLSGKKALINQTLNPPNIWAICKQRTTRKSQNEICNTLWSTMSRWEIFLKTGLCKKGTLKTCKYWKPCPNSQKINSERRSRLCADSGTLHHFRISFKALKWASKVTSNHLCQGCVVTCALSKTQTAFTTSLPVVKYTPKVHSAAAK